jgi:uncharacterized membrane protein
MNRSTWYVLWRIVVTFFVAAGFGFAIVQEQILVGLAILAAGFAILQVLRVRYKSVVLADERTKRINEKAGLGTFWFFMVSGAILTLLGLVLSYVGIEIQLLKTFVEPLSYLILGLMLVYSILTLYYSRKM